MIFLIAVHNFPCILYTILQKKIFSFAACLNGWSNKS
jgi:hypothetical protein